MTIYSFTDVLRRRFFTSAYSLPLACVIVCSQLFMSDVYAESSDTSSENISINVSASEPVNINVASPAVLALELNGIGLSKAEAIVLYRETHGAFNTVDELVNVKGIGEKTVNKLRSRIVAGEFIQPKKGESLAEQESAARQEVQAVVKRSLALRKDASGPN